MNWGLVAPGVLLWALVGVECVAAFALRTGRVPRSDTPEAGRLAAALRLRGRWGEGGAWSFVAVVVLFLLGPLFLAWSVLRLLVQIVKLSGEQGACALVGHDGVLADGGVRCAHCATWLVRPCGRS